QMERAARAAIEELEQGHTKSARASLAAGVGALNEAARILPGATRLARGAVRALDDELTRTGDHGHDGRPAWILDRRRADRRQGRRRGPGVAARRGRARAPPPRRRPRRRGSYRRRRPGQTARDAPPGPGGCRRWMHAWRFPLGSARRLPPP